jgi:hypothetical protein
MTARANYERRMAHTFSEDVKRAEFTQKIQMDKILMGNATSDERVANKRRARVAGEQAQVIPWACYRTHRTHRSCVLSVAGCRHPRAEACRSAGGGGRQRAICCV